MSQVATSHLLATGGLYSHHLSLPAPGIHLQADAWPHLSRDALACGLALALHHGVDRAGRTCLNLSWDLGLHALQMRRRRRRLPVYQRKRSSHTGHYPTSAPLLHPGMGAEFGLYTCTLQNGSALTMPPARWEAIVEPVVVMDIVKSPLVSNEP